MMIILSSCDKYKFDGHLIKDPNDISELYSKASEVVTINNQDLFIQPDLYRNFMPGGLSKKDHRLVAHCSLSDMDKNAIPDNLEIKFMYVINDSEAWKTFPTIDDNSSSDYSISFYSAEGPNWDTGIEVDVVLEVVSNGKTYFIISNDNEIKKIE